jgi:hypothetical protein
MRRLVRSCCRGLTIASTPLSDRGSQNSSKLAAPLSDASSQSALAVDRACSDFLAFCRCVRPVFAALNPRRRGRPHYILAQYSIAILPLSV